MRKPSLKLVNEWLSLFGDITVGKERRAWHFCMACPRKIPFCVFSRQCSVVGQGFHLIEGDPLRMCFAKPDPSVSPAHIF